MSKNTGMGRKRFGSKGEAIDKCDVASHSKQCGKQRKVSKGEHLQTKPEFTK